MIQSQRTFPWQFSLAQLGVTITAIAVVCGVLVSEAPVAVKAPVVGAAMIAVCAAVWMLGRRLTVARSLWLQAIGELIMSFAFGFGFLFCMYACVAVAYLAAYLSVR